MVEVFAVASGKGGTGKTTSTLALGMALAEDYDVTVVDADTGMANLLFHTGLTDVDITLHDLLIEESDVGLEEAIYDQFGMHVLPCGTNLDGFREASPELLRSVIVELSEQTDVILLDAPATLGSKSAVLPIVLADRTITVLQPTVPSLSDGLKVREYASAYGTGNAGVLFNRVTDQESVAEIQEQTERYFDGPILGMIPESETITAAREAGKPLLAYAPDAPVSNQYRKAAEKIEIQDREVAAVADRFQSAVIPEPP